MLKTRRQTCVKNKSLVPLLILMLSKRNQTSLLPVNNYQNVKNLYKILDLKYSVYCHYCYVIFYFKQTQSISNICYFVTPMLFIIVYCATFNRPNNFKIRSVMINT